MEDLQQLVSESLARNGFEIPQPGSREESALRETRLAASRGEQSSRIMNPAPLPAGF